MLSLVNKRDTPVAFSDPLFYTRDLQAVFTLKRKYM